jgi:hypothetical protein
MNRITGRFAGFVLVFIASCIAGLLPTTAQAQNQFNHQTNIMVGPDFSSGWASGYGSGQNAVVTNVSTSTHYYMNEESDRLVFSNTTYFSGNWCDDPSANSPEFDFLQEFGYNTSSRILMQEFVMGDGWAQFETAISLNISAHGGLWRYTNDNGEVDLFGNFQVSGDSYGVIPIHSWSELHVYADDHPDWLPDWELYIGSDWVSTTTFTPIPAPGAAAILGLGGLMAACRRRR